MVVECFCKIEVKGAYVGTGRTACRAWEASQFFEWTGDTEKRAKDCEDGKAKCDKCHFDEFFLVGFDPAFNFLHGAPFFFSHITPIQITPVVPFENI